MAGPRYVRIRLTARRSAAVVLALFLGAAACSRPAPQIVLATTTSMGNSGLLDVVLPEYRAAKVQPVLVGSGRALDMLAGGQADVVISHAPAREKQGLAAHVSWVYRKILYNDFLLVGPADDPARVSEAPSAAAAMKLIVSNNARFLSRGDESGTHERERELWTLAGIPQDGPHRVVAGAGMGQTLRIANATGAYTLTDRGTYEALRASLALKVVHQGDPSLLNGYAVIADRENARGLAFASWLAEGDGRALVARTLEGGQVKGFTLWPGDRPGTHPDHRPTGGS